MGDHIKARVAEIPFGKTIERLEVIRGKIDSVRASNPESTALASQLSELEADLKQAYADLASQASAKVANWQRGPILKKSGANKKG